MTSWVKACILGLSCAVIYTTSHLKRRVASTTVIPSQMKMPSKSVRTAQREAPSTLMLRRASETKVSGEYCVIVCNHSGMLEREQKMPERNTHGKEPRLANGAAAAALFKAPEVG